MVMIHFTSLFVDGELINTLDCFFKIQKKTFFYNLMKRIMYFQNGNECFCGTQIRFSPMSLPPNECSMQCSGNAMETCGGYWKIEIYPI